MRNASITIPRLLWALVLIAGFAETLSAVARDRGAYPRSPKFEDDKLIRDGFQVYIRNRSWFDVLSMLRNRDMEKDEKKFGKLCDYNENKMKDDETSGNTIDEDAKDSENEAKTLPSDKKPPSLTSRTIIEVPVFPCPEGQRLDKNGVCREIIN
ncbi:uncharacterized protein LOC122399119 [Colletes gigas]|uniref:uncharacterized protein LOC122399119 n=1 Tax=Colletes gigas TaxID=935657 RepID=UPI001C9AF043|nr:uncharacterized protein LOC122399119 [Colletes gigas]